MDWGPCLGALGRGAELQAEGVARHSRCGKDALDLGRGGAVDRAGTPDRLLLE